MGILHCRGSESDRRFLFQEIMSDEEYGEKFCRILLSTILNRPIRNVRITPQKNILGIDTNCHGIRMDAYIEELPETSLCDAEISSDVYDIEPDNGSDRHLLLLCGKSCKKTVPFRIFPRL